MSIYTSYPLLPGKCFSSISDQRSQVYQSVLKNQNSQTNFLERKTEIIVNENINKNNVEKLYTKSIVPYIQNIKENFHKKETITNKIKYKSSKNLKFWKNKNKTFISEYNNQCLIFSTTVFFREGKFSNCLFLYKESKLIITNNKLYVFPNITSVMNKDILLFINFNLSSCILLCNKKNNNEFSILILGTSKQYSFIINNKEIKEKFTFIIGNIIFSSKGHKNNLLGLSLNKNNDNKTIFIRPKEFESKAKTGDLLLFKSFHRHARLQRIFTCDNYDHIAIVQKYEGIIKMYESSCNFKCKKFEWSSFKSYFHNLLFEKVVYRKLIILNKEKKKYFQDNIEKLMDEFYKETKHKDYYLSIFRMIFKTQPEEYEILKDWSKAKGFCCSSLVAAFYLKLGIINLNCSVHCMKPGDFEQNKKSFVFNPGFFLGPEEIIAFSS